MIVNFKKTTAGNYLVYYKGYYIFSFKKPNKSYACRIGKDGKWMWTEGYFGTYLKTIDDVKRWAKSKIDTQTLIKKIGKK